MSSVFKALFARPESVDSRKVLEARRQALLAEGQKKGRQSTILTLGTQMSDGSAASGRPTLLGG